MTELEYAVSTPKPVARGDSKRRRARIIRIVYVLRHLASILVLPFTVTVVVPLWLLSRGSDMRVAAASTTIRVAAVTLGVTVFACGLALVVATIRHFARVGRGTLAPWDPPRAFVARGVYRRVRNPMISGVLLIVLAEVIVTGSQRLLLWLGTFLLVNLIYIPLSEEPGLAARFGERYQLYREHVPRWIPRRTPWTPPWEPGETE